MPEIWYYSTCQLGTNPISFLLIEIGRNIATAFRQNHHTGRNWENFVIKITTSSYISLSYDNWRAFRRITISDLYTFNAIIFLFQVILVYLIIKLSYRSIEDRTSVVDQFARIGALSARVISAWKGQPYAAKERTEYLMPTSTLRIVMKWGIIRPAKEHC